MIKFLLKKLLRFTRNRNFKNKRNLVKQILGNKNLRLLDVGAAGGVENFQDEWQPFLKNIILILCEPHKGSLEKIKKHNLRIIDKALSNEKKLNNIFYETKKPECSGLKEPNKDYLKKFPEVDRFDIIKKSNIETSTIDHEFNLKNFPHFVKIDTEGSELDILKGGEKILENILGLVVEINFFDFHKNQVKFEEIKNFLSNKKIELIDFTRTVKWERHNHRHHGQIQVADTLFLRSPENLLLKYNAKSIDLDVVRFYVTILIVYNRSDYINFLLKKMNSEEKKVLLLEECYNVVEKSVKKIHLIEKMSKLAFKYLI